MSNVTALKSPVLIDRLGARNLAISAVYVVAGIALIAGAAQIQIPMWPVPITGQSFAVLLVGASLGPIRAVISTSGYLLLAVLGLPILAPQPDGSHTTGLAVLALPTLGYLIGFIVASIALGWFAKLAWDRKVLKAVISFLLAEAIFYVCGLPVLWAWMNNNSGVVESLGANVTPATLLAWGLTPFIVGDLIKALLAGALLPLSWKLVNRKAS
jgi:biotin transport system substrate-specific component